MLNTATIMGRLGRDPEARTTGSGVSVASFTVAVDRDFTNSSGQRETDWISVTAWRQTADFVCNNFRKGSMIVVQGRLQTRTYEAQDGGKRSVTEIVADRAWFGGSKREDTQSTPVQQSEQSAAHGHAQQPESNTQQDMRQMGFDEINDDELPF